MTYRSDIKWNYNKAYSPTKYPVRVCVLWLEMYNTNTNLCKKFKHIHLIVYIHIMMTRKEGVLPLNEFQSAGCLILILKVEYVVNCKHSSKSRCKCWCDALRDYTALKGDHPTFNCDLPCCT